MQANMPGLPELPPDDDAAIVDEEVPIYDVVMKVDAYKALPELPEGFRMFGAEVVRPSKRPGHREVHFKVDDKSMVVLGFASRDAMMRAFIHLWHQIMADDTCDDCGKNIVNAAYGFRDEPGRYCSEHAEARSRRARRL